LLTARQLAAWLQNRARGGETCQVSAGEAPEARVIISGVVKVQTAGQLARGCAYAFIQAAGGEALACGHCTTGVAVCAKGVAAGGIRGPVRGHF